MFLSLHSRCRLLLCGALMMLDKGFSSERSCVRTALFARQPTGYVRPEHVIKSKRVMSSLECGFVCRQETDCVSFYLRREENKSYLCTLNRAKASSHLPPGGQSNEEDYYEMLEPYKNACTDSPCANGGTCFESCDIPGYWCHCVSPYHGVNCTTALGDSSLYAARSCQDIFQLRSEAKSRPYYVKTLSPNGYSHVYCHMESIPGCGEGGWTLVMKIDGYSKTFSFDSSLWRNKDIFNTSNGLGLEQQETKLATFWSTSFSKICLGMTYNNETKWLKLIHSAASLFDVISSGIQTPTNATYTNWKSLVNGSSLQTKCIRQGFNVGIPSSPTSAQVRIGIIGFSNDKCGGSSESRLGFGASGDMYGMDPQNSCGNEAQNGADNGNKSLKTFGFIFVQ